MIVAVALVAVALAAQPAQAPKEQGVAKSESAKSATNPKSSNKSQEPAQAGNHPPAPTPAPTSQPATKAGESGAPTEAENIRIQWWIEVFTGVLAGVGLLQAVLMFLTWRVYRRQAHEMRRQRHEMRRQRSVMHHQWQAMRSQLKQMESSGEQTERLIAQSATSANAAKDNAIAAKLTAEASERSVKALIGKERARIRVEPHKLKLVKPDEYTLQEVSFALEVIGTTPAFIVESTATAFISRSEEPSNWKLNLPMGLSAILKPSATLRTALIWDALHNDGTFEEIRDGIAFVHFYGRIEYVDVFDEKRVTSFRYVWKYFDSPLGVLRKTTGERSGYWLTCGEPEDNKQT